MREAMFIKKNAEKWSYAKTFYPKSKVTRWVNGIAAGIYQSIYKNKKEKYSRIFQFWKFELPLLFKRYHRIFLFTTVLFVLFVGIGVFSSIQNPEFVRGILGDNYVDMTEENIEKGDPFGVYKDGNPFSMFVYIAFNNIAVAFNTFIGGFTLGIFTIYIMWSNGLMLGTFQHMFFAKGLGIKSVLVIWIHGTLEIWAIVIAATAGLILASGILFPGTYARMVSFKRGAKDAAKVLIALVPIFIVAAFFESYVTHLMSQTYDKANNTGLPVWASVSILAVSLAFIIWYFIIPPIRLHKKGYYIQPDGIINRLNEDNA
jgi:uncharacterized membrane protein SpoIIM required for sporulation